MRTFVVASSPTASEPDHLHPLEEDLVIAADGGANLCSLWGWPVDMVVGDMDSVTLAVAERLQASGVPFYRHPTEKDETDLELALQLALQAGASEIIIAGALGARIDHTLGNLALLALPDLAGHSCRIVDGSQTIWLVNRELQVNGDPGDTLSLLAYGGDASGVTVTGVYWPLTRAELPVGPSLGISNRLVEATARVRVLDGRLLVVHIRQGGMT